MEALVRSLVLAVPQNAVPEVLASVRIPAHELAARIAWNEKRYARTHLARRPDFELVLVGYGPGQATSIHDYGSSQAWVRMVSGRLLEEHFDPQDRDHPLPVVTTELAAGTVRHLGVDRGVHRFINPGEERCITLNVYVGPVLQWRVYSDRGHAWMPVGT